MVSEPKTRSDLDVLSAIERGDVVTQVALTKRIGVSVGLINALLKRAIHKGFVKTRQVPYRRYAYFLTPTGFAEKGRLVAEYLDHSLSFFRTARNEYAELMASARRNGATRLVLVGGGELAEIAVLAAWSEDISLVGIVDPEWNQSSRYGLDVLRSLAEADGFAAVLITDARTPQYRYDEVRASHPETPVLAPSFLKITQDQGELATTWKRAEDTP